MKKQLIAGCSVVVFALQCSYASSINTHDLEKRSFEVAYQLNRLAELNSTDLCVGDVSIAAAYIESAGQQLQRDQQIKARTSLAYGHNELKEISTARSYCAKIAAQVKPYFAKVILIKSELENETLPEPDQTSD
ncbi:TPA: hypothetical protein JBG89_11480 [Legionella pneumophila]|jgi:predicted short-subunit dehydrogenase-like oxidoreductase (DUF2520 family)|nr:hypothetical protein [Legionella pneumophila]